MTQTSRELPELHLGDRFEVQSRSGSRYTFTFLAFGSGESGFFVRLEDSRIARIDLKRLAWETFADLPGEPSVLWPGDDVLVVSAAEPVRGVLSAAPDLEGLALRSAAGEVRLPWGEVEELQLLFRARDLKVGDAVLVNSRSGNEYRGRVLAIEPGRHLHLESPARELSLKVSRLDLTSLLVAIPLPLARLSGMTVAG